MKEIGIFEAKTKLSEICARVAETQEEYVVTRRGKPIARILPPLPEEKPKRRNIIEDMAETERLYGPMPEDEPDFPDVWLMRGRSDRPSPFEDDPLPPDNPKD